MKLQFNLPVGQKVAKVLILGKEIAYKDYNTDYEDDNCIVSYNLWMNGGNTALVFTCKSEPTIYPQPSHPHLSHTLVFHVI